MPGIPLPYEPSVLKAYQATFDSFIHCHFDGKMAHYRVSGDTLPPTAIPSTVIPFAASHCCCETKLNEILFICVSVYMLAC